MSAFFGSPARASFLVGGSDKDLKDTQLFQDRKIVQCAMNEHSSPGAKSPAKRGGWTGSPLKKRGQNQPSVDGGHLRRLVEGDDLASSSEGVIDETEASSVDQSAQERSAFDGASMDQRSLAMSTEFFDAEEALESVSDISTQPDDSLGLRERLQQEIRARVLAQEALAALQTERTELLRRLEESRSTRGAGDVPSEGAADGPLEGKPAEGGSMDAAGDPPEAAATSFSGDAGKATEGRRDKPAEGVDKRAEGARIPPERVDLDTTGLDGDAGKSGEGFRWTEGGSAVSKTESDQHASPAESPNELETMNGGLESVSGTEAGVRGEGGRTPPEAQPGPGGAPNAESAAASAGEKDSVRAEGGLKEALAKKDLEIARLKERLDYWDRVNEEYRVQREEAKEKKREARRRYQRQRAWTVGLLGGAVGLCIIGGAAYGAYRYWHGDLPFVAAGSDEKSSATAPTSSQVVYESSRVVANDQS